MQQQQLCYNCVLQRQQQDGKQSACFVSHEQGQLGTYLCQRAKVEVHLQGAADLCLTQSLYSMLKCSLQAHTSCITNLRMFAIQGSSNSSAAFPATDACTLCSTADVSWSVLEMSQHKAGLR